MLLNNSRPHSPTACFPAFRLCTIAVASAIVLAVAGGLASAQPASAPPSPTSPAQAAKQSSLLGPFTQGVHMTNVVRSGRSLVRLDAFAAAQASALARGEALRAPQEGDTITLPDGSTAAWKSVGVNAAGAFDAEVGRGGYLFCTRESDASQPRVLVLEAKGHGVAIVNGEPRMGDPYGYGYMALPVLIKPGTNTFAFSPAGRGEFAASLREPTSSVEIETRDMTLPDVVAGAEKETLLVALPLRNCTDEQQAVVIEWRTPGSGSQAPGAWARGDQVVLPPLSLTKHGLRTSAACLVQASEATLDMRIVRYDAQTETELANATLTLRVREANQTHKVTFRDELDNSVQYYAVVPPLKKTATKPGLVLSLHGASVEALNQAESYAGKPDLWIVCPTNRRPFGFDWEDWGRHDALAVLAHAKATIDVDESRIYLTGHSMGGHGTWQLGSLFPDQFAALAPSAGWISFDTYPQVAQPRTHAMAIASQRAGATSNTLAMQSNLANLGVFILHGDADDNVPVDQARAMADVLKGFHSDYRMHIEAGANHWWDSGEFASFAGAACTDFPPTFEFFARRRRAQGADVSRVHFTTVNPFVSARCHFASITRQRVQGDASTISLTLDRANAALTGTTSNVQELVLHDEAFAGLARKQDAEATPAGTLAITLDGEALQATQAQNVLRRVQETWQVESSASQPIPASAKDGFTLAKFLLVYPTMGTAEENAAGYAKARFDAEQWLYRGNGSVELRSDARYAQRFDAAGLPPTHAVLYGNEQSNALWSVLAKDFSWRVVRGAISRVPLPGQGSLALPGERWEGNDFALMTIEQIKAAHASAGAIAPAGQAREGRAYLLMGATGAAGDHALSRAPMFVSGAGIAPQTLLKADVFEKGWDGVLVAEPLAGD